MANDNSRNIRLGVFVVTGTLLLILALYLIGDKQNLFGSSIRVTASFNDIGGLMQGNNVRFAGIDVGTVESVDIQNDSLVIVTMVIKKSVQKFIKKNAVATVGTDGLMGNRLVNVNSSKDPAPQIEEGDVLRTRKPVEMDEMMRTLEYTNDNIRAITTDLRNITHKISSKNNLWNILLDTVVAENVKTTIVNLKVISSDGVRVTGDLKWMANNIRAGKGTIGALITDTVLSANIKQTIVKLENFTDTAGTISGDLAIITRNLKNGKGSLGILLTDTMLVHNLNKSILHIDTGAVNLNEKLDALEHSWPFKKYYKKKKGK